MKDGVSTNVPVPKIFVLVSEDRVERLNVALVLAELAVVLRGVEVVLVLVDVGRLAGLQRVGRVDHRVVPAVGYTYR